MVTVIKLRNLKFKVNANDHQPPHVHIEGAGSSIRVNLLTMEIMDGNTGFSESLVRQIIEYVLDNREILLEKWVEYHEK